MPALALDTNAAVKKLEHGGLTRAQADAITEVIQTIDISELATKHDLELTIEKQTIKLIAWFSGALLAQAALVVALIEYLK
jgi:hypothetical protein